MFELASQVSALEAVEKYAGVIPTRKGNRYICSCPFLDHADRHPSFTLGGDKFPLGFICSCGRKGVNAIDFVSQYKGLDRVESARLICQDFGLKPAKYRKKSGPQTGQQQPERLSDKSLAKFDTFLVSAVKLYNVYLDDVDKQSMYLLQLVESGEMSQEDADRSEESYEEQRMRLVEVRNRLRQLSNEFQQADRDGDKETLQRIASSFPRETFLQIADEINKYRAKINGEKYA